VEYAAFPVHSGYSHPPHSSMRRSATPFSAADTSSSTSPTHIASTARSHSLPSTSWSSARFHRSSAASSCAFSRSTSGARRSCLANQSTLSTRPFSRTHSGRCPHSRHSAPASSTSSEHARLTRIRSILVRPRPPSRDSADVANVHRTLSAAPASSCASANGPPGPTSRVRSPHCRLPAPPSSPLKSPITTMGMFMSHAVTASHSAASNASRCFRSSSSGAYTDTIHSPLGNAFEGRMEITCSRRMACSRVHAGVRGLIAFTATPGPARNPTPPLIPRTFPSRSCSAGCPWWSRRRNAAHAVRSRSSCTLASRVSCSATMSQPHPAISSAFCRDHTDTFQHPSLSDPAASSCS
jgi:hypothetical protein